MQHMVLFQVYVGGWREFFTHEALNVQGVYFDLYDLA